MALAGLQEVAELGGRILIVCLRGQVEGLPGGLNGFRGVACFVIDFGQFGKGAPVAVVA